MLCTCYIALPQCSVAEGCIQSLDWNTGLDYCTGLLDSVVVRDTQYFRTALSITLSLKSRQMAAAQKLLAYLTPAHQRAHGHTVLTTLTVWSWVRWRVGVS